METLYTILKVAGMSSKVLASTTDFEEAQKAFSNGIWSLPPSMLEGVTPQKINEGIQNNKPFSFVVGSGEKQVSIWFLCDPKIETKKIGKLVL